MQKMKAGLILAALAAISIAPSAAQQRTQPVRPPAELRTQPTLAEAPIQLQDAAAAQGAARQWATQSFVQSAPAGFGSVNQHYGQMTVQQTLIRFSLVNPVIGNISVDVHCFDASGASVAVEHATVAEAGGGAFNSGSIALSGRAARLVNVKTAPGIETWCRATGSAPFLFAASQASYERLANPGGDKIRVVQTSLHSFVLMK